MKTKNSFIDTDIIMKIGGIKGEKLLRTILCSLNYNLFIHEYVMYEELIFDAHALEQLDEMIKLNEVSIMRESDLNKEELEEYNLAVDILAKDMKVDIKKTRHKNAGEVKSMAMAFTKDYEYFISDDKEARVVAKRNLQKIDGTYLETIRLEDIIVHIKNNYETIGISRKTAKNLFLYGTSPKLGKSESEKTKLKKHRDRLKEIFDNKLWPVE